MPWKSSDAEKPEASAAFGQNDIISGRNIIMCVLKGKSHIAVSAKDMNHPSNTLQCAELLPGVAKNDSVKIRVAHCPCLFDGKNSKNHEK